MKPVLQTVSGHPGNCFAAALASILHVELSEIPDVTHGSLDGPEWWDVFTAWLDEQGLSALVIDQANPPFRHPTGFGIGLVPSDIKGCNHAVVTEGQRVVWDPGGMGPSAYEGKVHFILVMVPKDPALFHTTAQLKALRESEQVACVLESASEIARLYREATEKHDQALHADEVQEAFGLVNDATERMIQHLEELSHG